MYNIFNIFELQFSGLGTGTEKSFSKLIRSRGLNFQFIKLFMRIKDNTYKINIFKSEIFGYKRCVVKGYKIPSQS